MSDCDQSLQSDFAGRGHIQSHHARIGDDIQSERERYAVRALLEALPPVANTEFIRSLLLPPWLSPATPTGGGLTALPSGPPKPWAFLKKNCLTIQYVSKQNLPSPNPGLHLKKVTIHRLERALRRVAAFEREAVRAALQVEAHEVRRERLVRGVHLRRVAAPVVHAGLEVGSDPGEDVSKD